MITDIVCLGLNNTQGAYEMQFDGSVIGETYRVETDITYTYTLLLEICKHKYVMSTPARFSTTLFEACIK